MSTEEERAAAAYAEAGVELPELKKGEDTPAEEKPTPTQNADAPKEEPKADTENEPLQEPKEDVRKKRSIYDDLKDKKSELKSEREARLATERENQELKEKLAALQNADTPQEKREAATDLQAFAEKIGADAATLEEMRQLFLKGLPAQKQDEAIAQQLAEFQEWKQQNQKVVDAQQFDTEFKEALPRLKQYFPNASDEEMSSIRAELDKISHTKEWHDKSLAYIAFEHQDLLGKLVSPKKRGMESKGRQEDAASGDEEFDFNADTTKMSPTAREKWFDEYRKRTAGDGIITDAQGRRTII